MQLSNARLVRVKVVGVVEVEDDFWKHVFPLFAVGTAFKQHRIKLKFTNIKSEQ